MAGWNFTSYTDDDSDDTLYNVKQSLSSILVTSIAITVPMFFEILVRIYFTMERISESRIPYIILVLALFLPDLLILMVAIPLKSISILRCLFNLRLILSLYVILGHFWNSKLPIFKCKWIFLSALFLDVALVLANTSYFLSTNVQPLIYNIANAILTIGFLLFIYVAIL